MAYLQKAIKKLKSDGGITIRLPIAEWSRGEMALEVHCDDGDILTKGEVKRRSGSVVSLEKRRIGE